MKQILLLLAITMLIGNNADAQTRQRARVKQGVRSGEITQRERVIIANQRQDVRVATSVAKSDGVITQGERKAIQREKRQANRAIYRAKHNNHKRY